MFTNPDTARWRAVSAPEYRTGHIPGFAAAVPVSWSIRSCVSVPHSAWSIACVTVRSDPQNQLLPAQGDRGSELSVEDLLRIVRTLPADASAVTAVREG